MERAETIKQVHLAYRNAIRQGGMDPSLATVQRDAAICRIQEQERARQTIQMNMAHEIMPNVFLGPFVVARDAEQLKALGITHIVCLSAEGCCPFGGHITYLEHPLIERKCHIQDIVRTVPSCVSFVHKAISSSSRNRVLIHCLHGRTRSAAVASCVRAVLLGDTFREAYGYVTRVRDVFVPVEWYDVLQGAVAALQ
mmetsp:Transcript_16318/g.26559  ORF Transcript_16318/g.26559 Transcript_16318/m.26559 type:complete len:197 (+) Transcript_16318:182-772(+)